MLASYGIRPPRWMTTLGRTFVTLDGTLRCVDPNFSLIDTAMSVASQHVHRMVRPESLKDAVQAEATRQLPRLRRLPERIDDLLGQASRGRLTARVSLFADGHDLDTITRLVDRVVLAILAAALGIGSVLLLHVESGPRVSDSVAVNEVLGYIGLALSTILTLRIVAGIIRDGLT
jgi:ubiquinone biosynthesis protein